MTRHGVRRVDDEQEIRWTLTLTLEEDHEGFTATHGAAVLDMRKPQKRALIRAESRMPGRAGVERLERAGHLRRSLTGYTDPPP